MASTNPATSVDAPQKKKLILNAFVESCSGHQSPGLWQHGKMTNERSARVFANEE